MNHFLRIGLDCDESAFDFIEPLSRFLKSQEIDVPGYAETDTFNLWDAWKCSRDEAFRRVNMFYHSEEIKKIPPRRGALEAMGVVSPPNKTYVVTSRPGYMAGVTRASFDEHFSNRFEWIYHTEQYSPHIPAENVKVTKGTVARDLDLDVFVEDALHHAEEIASYGIPVFLLPTPWNSGKKTSELITRGEWSEFPDFVKRLATYKYAQSQGK